MEKKKRIVIALGGNALGNTLPEQMTAVKITARAIVDLIEEGCEVVVAHGNGPQVGMINNAMAALQAGVVFGKRRGKGRNYPKVERGGNPGRTGIGGAFGEILV